MEADKDLVNDARRPIVVALGGNAISPLGEPGDITAQFRHTRLSCRSLANIAGGGVPLAITHGNGPQVGAALRRVELSAREIYPLDLGICVADIQGGMDYRIGQCLMNELHQRGQRRLVTTLVTSVEVDPDDPALAKATKPIGSRFDSDEARLHAERHGWAMAEVSGGWRRVVASPRPQHIVEIDVIRQCLDAGNIVISVGGGGVPVYRDAQGVLHGLEAVIDKDLASGLLARALGARALVILTAVSGVFVDFGTVAERAIERITVAEARRLYDEGQFPAGSMGPKMLACIEYLEGVDAPDARAHIGDLTQLDDILAGKAGTTITRT
jgi:carbamate kinase